MIVIVAPTYAQAKAYKQRYPHTLDKAKILREYDELQSTRYPDTVYHLVQWRAIDRYVLAYLHMFCGEKRHFVF